MSFTGTSALFITLTILLCILIAGIIVMAIGGKFSKKYSNKLMMARVITQFIALIILFLLFLFKK